MRYHILNLWLHHQTLETLNSPCLHVQVYLLSRVVGLLQHCSPTMECWVQLAPTFSSFEKRVKYIFLNLYFSIVSTALNVAFIVLLYFILIIGLYVESCRGFPKGSTEIENNRQINLQLSRVLQKVNFFIAMTVISQLA